MFHFNQEKNMKKKQTQYRQGDVLIQLISTKVPKTYKPVELDAGRVVLMYGEVTGHAHAIKSPNAKLWREAGDIAKTLLEVQKTVVLRHEEHAPIELAPGNYRIVRQREYHPVEIKYVTD
jgi:hypothetical protein